MLILTRKANEEIAIGEDVRVVVLDVRGNRVHLGLIAPNHVEIRRVEVDPPEEGEASAVDLRQIHGPSEK